LKIVNY